MLKPPRASSPPGIDHRNRHVAEIATQCRQRVKSHDDGGLGLGTLGTSALFLTTILAVVVYLTKTHKDQTELVYHGSE